MNNRFLIAYFCVAQAVIAGKQDNEKNSESPRKTKIIEKPSIREPKTEVEKIVQEMRMPNILEPKTEAEKILQKIGMCYALNVFKKESLEHVKEKVAKMDQEIYPNIDFSLKEVQKGSEEMKKMEEDIHKKLSSIPHQVAFEAEYNPEGMEILNRAVNALLDAAQERETNFESYRKEALEIAEKVLSEDEKSNKIYCQWVQEFEKTISLDEEELKEQESQYKALKRSEREG